MKKKRVILIINVVTTIFILTALVSSIINNKGLKKINESLISSNKKLTEDITVVKDENEKYKSDIDILNKEKDEVTSKLNEAFTTEERMIKRIEEKGYIDYKDILNDLVLHPELIPYEGVLGGTMA